MWISEKSTVDHDKIKYMTCKHRKKSKYRRKNALAAKITCFFLLLSFAFTLSAACSESSSSDNETTKSVTGTPTEDDQSQMPIPDIEVVEPMFYVGLPGEREDRFSLAYAQAEDMTLNPFLDVQGADVFSPHNFIYEKLLRYDKNKGTYESNILESINFSDREFVLHLFKDISFHNGSNLLASDVLQTFALFQSSGHELGQHLDDSIASYALDSDFTLRITLSDNEDAALTFFDCLEKIPILPYQLWDAQVSAGSDLAALQEITPLPTIGSGPYRLLRQDNFVLILEKHTQSSGFDSSVSFDDFPQYLVYYKYQKEELAQAALANSDLDILVRPENTHPQKSLKDALDSFADMSFWKPDTAENIFTLSVQEKRMGIALNPDSDQLQKIATRKVVQSLMLRLDNPQQSLYPTVPNIVSLPAGNQLTLPSILSHNLTRADFQLLPSTAPQDTNAYLAESNWDRDPQSGIILDENGKAVELDFYYPVSTTELANVCRQIAGIAADNGLGVIAREVSVEEWQTRLQDRDYDLIYMESFPDETIPQMITRIQLWPGLALGSELEDSSDFAAESGRQLLQECKNDALAFNSIITHLQNLNVFLLENNIFIPLGIANETGGIGSDLFFSFGLSEELQSY